MTTILDNFPSKAVCYSRILLSISLYMTVTHVRGLDSYKTWVNSSFVQLNACTNMELTDPIYVI